MTKGETLRKAIHTRRCVELRYDGFRRLVEVHAYGVTHKGHEVLRVWQVSGGSVHDEEVGWKLLRLDETSGVSLAPETSQAPRKGYRKGDTAMLVINCQV